MWSDPERRAQRCAAISAGQRRRQEQLHQRSEQSTPAITLAPAAGSRLEDHTGGILAQLPHQERARYLAADDVARRCVPLLVPSPYPTYIDDYMAMLKATERYLKLAMKSGAVRPTAKPEPQELEELAAGEEQP